MVGSAHLSKKNWQSKHADDKKFFMQIHVNKYPQLRTLCWNRANDAVVDGMEALGLYENNWRMVEPEKLDKEEQELLDLLVARFGNGVFMPT